MHRIVEYTLLFLALVLLQVFLFDKIGITLYVSPLIYVAFIILLPVEIPGALLLGLALVTGVTMDFFMALAGVNTAATLFMAFCRPAALNYLAGREEVREAGVPDVNRLGGKRFVRYTYVLILLHHLVFFVLESLSWKYLYITLIRALLSSLLTLLLVYFSQRLFATGRSGRFGAND